MSGATTARTVTEEGRALLTETERKILTGEQDATDNYQYKVKSLVRNRIKKHLGDDIDALEEHFPEVHQLVIDEVCDRDGEGADDA